MIYALILYMLFGYGWAVGVLGEYAGKTFLDFIFYVWVFLAILILWPTGLTLWLAMYLKGGRK